MQQFRDGYANLITSGGHLALLAVAAHINEPPAWVACFGLIALISFFAWSSTLRRGRAIADTPTSRIASAAQGYVEIYGRAKADSEHLLLSKNGSLPCVWYRCVTYRKNSDNKWAEIDRSVSDSLIEVQDASGHCMVDPDHAEVITTHRRTWYEGDYKHVEEQLLASDNIYALGEFVTVGGAHTPLDRDTDVKTLLAEWKRDQAGLLERFDLNRDGQIDMQEWGLARRAAMREIEKQHRELRLHGEVHLMRRPKDRLFLIANLSPQALRRKYYLWGWFHLAILFASLGAASWLGVRLALW
jgi:hypothetical protein